MLADLRILHVPSSDTNVLPPVILQLGADRYLFNVGEGTSRSSTQRKANLSKISNIFVSRVGWEAIGGLPGVLMSMADGQRASESLHGPEGLRYALATMRTYAKRDIMKLDINEIPAQPSSFSQSSPTPAFTDDNLAIYAVPLYPASAPHRANKKAKIDADRLPIPSAASLQKVDELWRRPYFNPSNLQGQEAQAWIYLVSNSIFNDSLLRKRQQDAASAQSASTNKIASSAEDVEMDDAEPVHPPSSPRACNASPWRPPLSPAFVNRPLSRPQTETRNLSAEHDDPAEGGQAPVLAYICEAHPQRGKFDPVKATQAGVSPGPSFAALTRGEDITLKRPMSWASMSQDERKKWLQAQRASQRGGAATKPKSNGKQNGNAKAQDGQNPTPAAWNDLEEVLVKSTDVVGQSRAGVVVFHIYLPSASYIPDLLSDKNASTFRPYTVDANQAALPEQSRTPHVIVHSVPLDVLQDARYQKWMRQFGPECHHIVANHDVCSNKLMFPSSATIPLRLSKLDDVMFKVPQYQLKPRVRLDELRNGAVSNFALQLIAAEADQVVPLHPRGEPKRYNSGAPDFDWPVQSEEAERAAAFEIGAGQETEQQAQQIAKAKAKNSAKSQKPPVTNADGNQDTSVDELGAFRSLRLREARKKAWEDYLDVVQKIRGDPLSGQGGVTPAKDVLVTTLGTGSAAPSKYRNVISTLLQTPSSGNILLDAGESTYGLLRRKFGCRRDGTAAESGSLVDQDVDDILRAMRVLFISHIHADHHIGLIRLLVERRKLQPRPDKLLYLVATGFVHNYLEEYEQIEKVGLDEDVVLVLNEHLDYKSGVDPNLDAKGVVAPASANGDSRSRQDHLAHVKAIKELTGLSHIHTARVVHRGAHCYGLVVRHATESWSVTYSGDTRPAPELIAAGRDCTLLIHEATLEDSELEMAIGKGHSTFGEAIRVGHEMGANNILLTHFSQRYPKMAKSSLFALSDTREGKNVPIALAFDMVTYPLSQFNKIQSYTPAMEALFAADMEGEDVEQAESVAGIQNETGGKGSGQQGKSQSNGTSNGLGVAAAATLGVVASANGETAGAPSQDGDKKETSTPEERYMRKGMKPSEWRYIGLRLSASPSTAAMPTLLPAFVLELVHTAQNATMGNIGGGFNVDILSTHPSRSSCVGWDAILRVQASHGQDLVTCLSTAPAPTVQETRLRVRVVGPATTIQTCQNLLS